MCRLQWRYAVRLAVEHTVMVVFLSLLLKSLQSAGSDGPALVLWVSPLELLPRGKGV